MIEFLVSAILRPLGDYLVFGLGRIIIRIVSFSRIECENSPMVFRRQWGRTTLGWFPTTFIGVLGWLAVGWVIATILDRHA